MTHHIVLECRNVSHRFGAKAVLHDIDLKIIRGEIVALVGPSGCGKSTLLRAIVGTHPPEQGQVYIWESETAQGQAVSGPGRDRGMVYQHYALFPFLTARENVAIGPMLDQTGIAFRFFRYRRWRQLRKTHLAQADALLETLKLADAGHLYPHEMSGGMRQRVAIAQALIMKPAILLLDEPFGALDEATREELQRMLLNLYAGNSAAKAAGKEPPYTILIVTHELNEAIYVGDRIVALSQYWDWQGEGFPHAPGATVVYDRVSPVFRPDDERDYKAFLQQRKSIRGVAFEAHPIQDRHENVRFWEEIAAGKGMGVLQ
ncbi:MAG: ATP-binding cassette domain-containing protein [Desulfatitalea sp.]|nr:ATP-binding cassette domain-containing protein [Desulfatitalea sp.]NNJ99857.1 ATP-binding cassette domain-containing protein [Desulfatitalea sp.]